MTPRKVSDLGRLSEAEEKVLAELDTGDVVLIGDGSVPEAGDESRRVSAVLIRLLLLGDDPEDRLHEKGLQIAGAWIPDLIDLEGCRDLPDLALVFCRLGRAPVLRSAGLRNLNLSKCHMPGLAANALVAKSNVFFEGIEANGEVQLVDATVGSNLNCVGATFRAGKETEGNPGYALSADRLEAKGNVFLEGVEATGEVRLLGATLGGYLDCEGATFRADNDAKGNPGDALAADHLSVKGGVIFRGVKTTGAVRLVGATLGGNLDCGGATFRAEDDAKGNPGDALILQRARIHGTLFLREGASVAGVLDFTAAEVGALSDDPACWPAKGDLMLAQCRFNAFLDAPVDAETRLRWLGLQDPSRWGAYFWPQPYEQCAKVLREMGHGEDARAILIEKERLQRAAMLARAPLEQRGILRLRDWMLWHTVRHGRQPLRAALWLSLFWAVGTVVFFAASDQGAIKPNNPVVLRSEQWAECAPREGRARLDCFFAESAGASYPRFNAFIYSADTLLPIVSLEMQDYWIPDEGTVRGAWARGYLWAHIAVGWALSLLAVAGFSGLVKSD